MPRRMSHDRHARYDRRPYAWRREGERRPAAGGFVEFFARLADAADQFSLARIENDPRYGAQTSGDVIRQMPERFREAMLSLNDGFIDAIDMRNYDAMGMPYDAPPPSYAGYRARAYGPVETVAPVQRDPIPEVDIVHSARDYILRGGQGGATLDGLIRYLRPQSGYAENEIETILARYFIIDGDLVFLPDSDEARNLSGISDLVEAHLKALGYSDLRRNVRLDRVGEDAPRAHLVAYSGEAPMVLVFPTRPGRLTQPQTIEDARFQAMALGPSTVPYIYLTDGKYSRYLDVTEDRILAVLPRAEDAKGRGVTEASSRRSGAKQSTES